MHYRNTFPKRTAICNTKHMSYHPISVMHSAERNGPECIMYQGNVQIIPRDIMHSVTLRSVQSKIFWYNASLKCGGNYNRQSAMERSALCLQVHLQITSKRHNALRPVALRPIHPYAAVVRPVLRTNRCTLERYMQLIDYTSSYFSLQVEKRFRRLV